MDDDIATFLEFLFTELEGGISTVRTAGDSDFLPWEGRISLTLPREDKRVLSP